tara:strand:+ start:72 stop:269 length:198 start_codon:yes stop_codon:yes gene_type:complete
MSKNKEEKILLFLEKIDIAKGMLKIGHDLERKKAPENRSKYYLAITFVDYEEYSIQVKKEKSSEY